MKALAPIAHDGKKTDMVSFAKGHKDLLARFPLVATSATGRLREKAGLDVTCMLSGPLGGDQRIGAMVAEEKVLAVIFLRDPLQVCDVHNVPLAANLVAAEAVLAWLRSGLPANGRQADR